jgi:hypothetical protein
MSSYIFEIAIDGVTFQSSTMTGTHLMDLRLSISLSDFPILHITPRSPTQSNRGCSETLVHFNGSGKLCELKITKPAFDNLNMVLLFLKEVSSIDDYLILAMTPAIRIRDLILSLPSGNDVPYARRSFAFLDEKGSCDALVRIRRIDNTHQKRNLRPTARSNPPRSIADAKVNSPIKPKDDIPKLHKGEPKPDDLENKSLLYGGFRKRNALIQ